MGMVLLATGDLEAARTHLQEALALSQTLNDRWALLNNFRLLGQVALAQHNEADARTFFEESLALCKEIGEFRMMALVLLSIGDMRYAHDERQAAAQHFREALHAAHQAHVVAVQLDSLARLAEIFHLDGQHQRAMELCRLILEHPAASAEAKQRTASLYEQLRAIAPTVCLLYTSDAADE